ncbi:MFS transporter [Camelimonas abortus]|uniref:MFS transporter n=1 Tax=Camelimonas abortus TaxID=1017184 RepID=A0ABV7LB67_9HYPH
MSPADASVRQSRIFYGWWIVAAMTVILFTTGGLAFYNLSVLLKAFVSERNFPVSMASSATALFFVTSGFAGMFAGRFIDRHDVRYFIVGSAILSACCLASLDLVRTAWRLYLFYALFGVAYGGCGLVPAMTVLTRWFDARRATALSIAMTGLSVGGAVITPLTAQLVNAVGLAGAGPWLGAAFFLGVAPLTVLVIRPSPESMGLNPDGAPATPGQKAGPARSGRTWAEARVTRFFWLVSVAYVFTMAAQVGGISHLYNMVSSRVDVETAALAVSVLAASSITGRLAGGVVLLRAPAIPFTLVAMAVQGAALLLISLAADRLLLLAAVALFGLPVGNLLMMQPLLMADAFGTREYARIYAAHSLVTMVGVAGGPIALGLLHDWLHGYGASYFCAALLGALGFVMLLLAGRPPAPAGAPPVAGA